MAEKQSNIFRKKTLERISSPEQLTDYLRVATPGIWVILVAVILLLAGILAWAAVGTLETKADVRVMVEGNAAIVIPVTYAEIKAGMPLRVGGEDVVLASVDDNGFGSQVGIASVNLPNGTYDGVIVTETIHPIEFLLNSR